MRILLLFSLISTISFGQNCTSRRYIDPIFTQVNTINNVKYGEARPYGSLFNQDLHLDFYEPLGDVMPARPTLVFLHGGAFLIGTRNQPPIPDWAEYYAKRGYVVVSVQYRLNFNSTSGGSAERAVYRAAQDLRAALRFLMDNRAIYRIDPNNIITTGTSAGSIAGIHSAFFEESERPASSFGIPIIEPNDLGCVNCSGNNNYGNQEVPVKAHVNYWGAIGDTSWINLPDNIPMMHLHGTSDAIVNYGSGQPFSLPIWPTLHGSSIIHQRLQNLGIRSVLHPMVGTGHEPEILESPRFLDTMYHYTTPFLFSVVKPNTSAISGNTNVRQLETHTYSVVASSGSTYCWTVTGGTVVGNGPSIQINWTQQGWQTVTVKELNAAGAEGEAVTLSVFVDAPVFVGQLVGSKVVFYPNPTVGILNIEWDATLGVNEVVLSDVLGREVVRQRAESYPFQLDLTDIQKGVYIFSLIHEGRRVEVRKVVKN